MESTKSAERGSAKLFTVAAHEPDALAHALGLARGEYEIKRWWKYGQPAIDLIKAEFQVSAQSLGPTVSKLLLMNSQQLQVTAEVFPYGITNPEFRLQVNIQKAE